MELFLVILFPFVPFLLPKQDLSFMKMLGKSKAAFLQQLELRRWLKAKNKPKFFCMFTCTACGLSPVQLCLRIPTVKGLCSVRNAVKPLEGKSRQIVVVWFSPFYLEECTFLGYTLNCQEAKSTLGILHGAWKVAPRSMAMQSFSHKSSSCFPYVSKLCININILFMGK